jgi:RuvA, C-terminal domain
MLTNIAYAAFGALLLFAGVMAGSLADRVRYGKQRRQREAREAVEVAPAAADRRSSAVRKTVPPSPAPTSAHEAMAADVVLALVGLGYPRAAAERAVAECPGAACSTLESWTRAALKRAMTAEIAAR